ncbi:sigma-70 family RNA polymerase sigma factor [Phascolarctobacterium faecium]|nr:sigma-70 family RNA polymerase sigma factor [Phascolarctobacterium faecium]MDM8109682.1 sigma-70 family RNA polymerase sigma factor [Phascolarctobacterium faecium]
MTDCKKLNNVTVLAGAKCDHPPHRKESAAGANAFAKMPADYDEQSKLTQQLVTAAQNGDKAALERLCIFYELLFRKEMKREIFYKALGFEEGLSLARLKFIEIVMSYNGADFSHFAGYVRCRIHFALYDEMKKAWERENNEAALPVSDDADVHLPADNPIDREELAILLKLALKKLTEKQRNTINALYFEGYSGKEFAAKQKITPAMVSKNHKQALKILRGNIA